MKVEFLRQIFSKNSQTSNFMKIRPVGGGLIHAGGQTDMTKVMVTFRIFANAPKDGALLSGLTAIAVWYVAVIYVLVWK
jgi:hypothetical protein